MQVGGAGLVAAASEAVPPIIAYAPAAAHEHCRTARAQGKMFDSSFHTGSLPQKLTLGAKDNVEAWNKGMQGMCEGERRTIKAPPSMAFGDKGTAKVRNDGMCAADSVRSRRPVPLPSPLPPLPRRGTASSSRWRG